MSPLGRKKSKNKRRNQGYPLQKVGIRDQALVPKAEVARTPTLNQAVERTRTTWMETMTTANPYKRDRGGNVPGVPPVGKEAGKAEGQGGGGDGAGGGGGAEGGEAGEDEAVAEEGEADGEGEEDEGEDPLEEPPEPPEPRGHVSPTTSLRPSLRTAGLAGGLVSLLELEPGTKAGGLFYITTIQTMTLLHALRIP